MKREPTYDWSLATLCLLFVAMAAFFVTPMIRSYQYSVESSQNEAIAEALVAPKLSFTQVDQEVQELKTKGMKLGDADYTQYFVILNRLRMLNLTAKILSNQKSEGEDMYRARQLLITINMTQNDMANNFLPRFRTVTNVGEIFNSPEFKQAQETAEDASALVRAVTPEGVYSFEGVARVWGYAYLSCLPFAFLGVCIQLQRRLQATPLEIGFAFLGDYRLCLRCFRDLFGGYPFTRCLCIEKD